MSAHPLSAVRAKLAPAQELNLHSQFGPAGPHAAVPAAEHAQQPPAMSSTTQHSKEQHDAASSHRATPGPWTCRESELSRHGNLWFIDADVSPAHQVRVAETWNESHARLIAASPRMYQALRKLVKEISQYHQTFDARLFVEAERAIAEAEGVPNAS